MVFDGHASVGHGKSVRDSSFFTRSQLSLKQIIILVYMWSRDQPQTEMICECRIDTEKT